MTLLRSTGFSSAIPNLSLRDLSLASFPSPSVVVVAAVAVVVGAGVRSIPNLSALALRFSSSTLVLSLISSSVKGVGVGLAGAGAVATTGVDSVAVEGDSSDGAGTASEAVESIARSRAISSSFFPVVGSDCATSNSYSSASSVSSVVATQAKQARTLSFGIVSAFSSAEDMAERGAKREGESASAISIRFHLLRSCQDELPRALSHALGHDQIRQSRVTTIGQPALTMIEEILFYYTLLRLSRRSVRHLIARGLLPTLKAFYLAAINASPSPPNLPPSRPAH